MIKSPNSIEDRADQEYEIRRPAGILLDEKKWLFLKKHYNMTPRELQVAILVCRGFNNNEIAKALKIKHGTVKTHLRNIYRRVRVKSKVLLLLKFVEEVNNYYSPGESKGSVPIAELPNKSVYSARTSEKNLH